MIAIVCTDRGQHKATFIATIDPDDPTRPDRGRRRLTEPATTVTHDSPGEPGMFVEDAAVTLACPRCGRAPQLSPAKLTQLVAGLVAAGKDRADVSCLPF